MLFEEAGAGCFRPGIQAGGDGRAAILRDEIRDPVITTKKKRRRFG